MFQNEDEELRKLREKWPELSYEDKLDQFLWKMVWFHHTKHIPGSPSQAINKLTETIESASTSSEKLTGSIRTATWVAAIIGGLALIVAAIKLLQDLNLLG